MMKLEIPNSVLPRVVIIGGGFAGLTLAQKINKQHFQIILLDQENFHTFQPLLYQVASAQIEPQSLAFPLRKAFQGEPNTYIRKTQVLAIDAEKKSVQTQDGELHYDYLVLAMGAKSHYFGLKDMEEHALTLKTLSDALDIRNTLLSDLEDWENKGVQSKNWVVVGAGATGVEMAGALADLRNKILKLDFPELDPKALKITLIEASGKALGAFAEGMGDVAVKHLKTLDVEVLLNTEVLSYDGTHLQIKDKQTIQSQTVIWTAGVRAQTVSGLEKFQLPNGRIGVDEYNQVLQGKDIFCIGDQASMQTQGYEKGHPQLAPVAIAQAENLAKNLVRAVFQKPMLAFAYHDKGSMVAVGLGVGVVRVFGKVWHGFWAFIVWFFVHLFQILGTKNKIFILLQWLSQYRSYNSALRIILKSKKE